MKIRVTVFLAAVAAFSVWGSLAMAQQFGGPQPGGMMLGSMRPGYGYPAPQMAAMYAPPAAPAIPGADLGPAMNEKLDGKSKKGKGEEGCRVALYGDFLYLRARDAEVAYAVPIDGPIAAPPTDFPIQVGPVGVADMDFQPGFRFGFRCNTNPLNALGAEYTFFESNSSDQVVTQVPDVLRSLVSHPGTQTAAQDFLQADAEYHLSHDIVDGNYYMLLQSTCEQQLTFVAGLRAMQHEQSFQVDFSGAGTESVITDIDFYGAGARAGLEFDKFISCQWLVYAKGYGNLIPGEFRADYDQSQSYDAVVVDTAWKAGRLVTIWDLELGVSWLSKCGNYRFNAGYLFSAWTNMVQTDEWIQGVQQNSFVDMDSTMTYDGLTARIEVRY